MARLTPLGTEPAGSPGPGGLKVAGQNGSAGLTIEEVSKSFGDLTAVNGVSLHVEPGTVYGLIGPNGAGKTTTMRMVMTILVPDRGQIRWNGRPVAEVAFRKFGYLPEERGLYPNMTIRDQLRFFAALHGMAGLAVDREIDRWIERLALGEHAAKKVEELSKGNAQKVQFIAALLHHPELLILDEPFSGLDPVNVHILKNTLLDLARNGTAILLSTHRMEHVEELCERMALIKGGSIVAEGTVTDVRRSTGRLRLRLAAEPGERVAELLASFDELPPARSTPFGWEVQLPAAFRAQAVLERALADLGATDPEQAVELPPGGDWPQVQAKLDPLVKQGRIDGYLWIGQSKEEGTGSGQFPGADVGAGAGTGTKAGPGASAGGLTARFTRKEVSNTDMGFVRALVEPLAAAERAVAAGLSPAQLAILNAPTDIEVRSISPRFSDRAQIFSEILTYFLLIALYMAAVLYGNMITMGVVHEKSNRVVELLVSAVRPIHILVGKVLGIGLAGLLQFGVWTAGGLAITLFSDPLQQFLKLEDGGSLLASIPLPILLYFTVFFLLGYFLYAVLNAGLASMASRVEEMNAVIFPGITLIMIAYFLAFASFTRADNPLVVIGSLIPFFTPMVMFTRVILIPVPAWQVALSIVLTLATIVGGLVLSARLYHANILRFRRVSWKEAWRTLAGRRAG